MGRNANAPVSGRPAHTGQNVPMFENIQYQNQMISPVPPHAATYRSTSQT